VVTTKKSLSQKGEGFDEDLNLSSAKNAHLIEIRHQQIADGACKVFFEKGYHPTTIREIAQACNMSMGQLYHYISSKDDVLYLVHKSMQRIWQEYLSKAGIAEIDDPVERLRHALSSTLEFMAEHTKLIQFVYTESKYLGKEHLRVVLEMDDGNVVGFWRDLLEEVGRKKAIAGDSDVLANLIAYILVFVPLRGWNLKDRPTEENLAFVKDFVLRGLGVDTRDYLNV